MNVELSERDKDTNRQERRERIKERESVQERKNRYWMEGEERRCRMYYEERDTIEHM
jgi:hypothetical protein